MDEDTKIQSEKNWLQIKTRLSYWKKDHGEFGAISSSGSMTVSVQKRLNDIDLAKFFCGREVETKRRLFQLGLAKTGTNYGSDPYKVDLRLKMEIPDEWLPQDDEEEDSESEDDEELIVDPKQNYMQRQLHTHTQKLQLDNLEATVKQAMDTVREKMREAVGVVQKRTSNRAGALKKQLEEAAMKKIMEAAGFCESYHEMCVKCHIADQLKTTLSSLSSKGTREKSKQLLHNELLASSFPSGKKITKRDFARAMGLSPQSLNGLNAKAALAYSDVEVPPTEWDGEDYDSELEQRLLHFESTMMKRFRDATGPKRKERADAVNLGEPYEYIHEMCAEENNDVNKMVACYNEAEDKVDVHHQHRQIMTMLEAYNEWPKHPTFTEFLIRHPDYHQHMIENDLTHPISYRLFYNAKCKCIKFDRNLHVCADEVITTLMQCLRTLDSIRKSIRAQGVVCDDPTCQCKNDDWKKNTKSQTNVLNYFTCGCKVQEGLTRGRADKTWQQAQEARSAHAKKVFEDLGANANKTAKREVNLSSQKADPLIDSGGEVSVPDLLCVNQLCANCGVGPRLRPCKLELEGEEIVHRKYVSTEQGKHMYKKLLEVKMTRANFFDEFQAALIAFLKHKRLCILDAHDMKLLEETFDGITTAVAKRDFMANYSCLGYYDPTCSSHAQVTCEVVAVSTHRREQDGHAFQRKRHYYFMATKCDEGPGMLGAGWQFDIDAMRKLLQELLRENPGLTTIYFCSDGCAAQYKCRLAAYCMSMLARELDIKHLHVFFHETGNGKNECDGGGFWLKNKFYSYERMNKARLEGAEACFKYISEQYPEPEFPDVPDAKPRPYRTVDGRYFYLLCADKNREEEESKNVINVDHSDPIDCTKAEGIRETHEWLFSSEWDEGVMKMRKRHCYCVTCRKHDYGEATACQQNEEMRWSDVRLQMITAEGEDNIPGAKQKPKKNPTHQYLKALYKYKKPFVDENARDDCILVAVPVEHDFYLCALLKPPHTARANDHRDWQCVGLGATFHSEKGDPELYVRVLAKMGTHDHTGKRVTALDERAKRDKDCLLVTNIFYPTQYTHNVPTEDVLQIPDAFLQLNAKSTTPYIKAKWDWLDDERKSYYYQVDLADLARLKIECETQELVRKHIVNRE